MSYLLTLLFVAFSIGYLVSKLLLKEADKLEGETKKSPENKKDEELSNCTSKSSSRKSLLQILLAMDSMIIIMLLLLIVHQIFQ